MLFRFIVSLFIRAGLLTPPNGRLSRPEYNPVIIPVVAHEQITGKLFVVEIGFCELRQVVTFFHDLVGEIFFIVILSLIFVLKIPYKVVRIFLVLVKLPAGFVKIFLARAGSGYSSLFTLSLLLSSTVLKPDCK